MSYMQHRSGGNRPAIIVTVAALHGAAFYALVTGLGAEYVEHIVDNLPTREYQDRVPPPEPEPQPRDEAAPEDSTVRAPETDILVPRSDPVMEVPTVLEIPERAMVKLPDFSRELPEIPVPLPYPSPSFAPKSALPKNAPGGWVSTSDYPSSDLRQGNEGSVGFRLTIDARGKVTGCQVTRSSGHGGLDAATCKYATQRARFEPATDGTGAKVSGSYSNVIRWVIPD